MGWCLSVFHHAKVIQSGAYQDLIEQKIAVEGLVCKACEVKLTKAFMDSGDVTNCQANFQDQSVVIRSTRRLDQTLITEIVSNAGFSFVKKESLVDTEDKGDHWVDIYGVPVSLSKWKGKIIVLEWTNYQCPFVVSHYESENIPNLQARYKRRSDVVWVSIVSSSKNKQGYVSQEEARQIYKGSNADHIVLDVSGDIGRQFKAKTTPHILIINALGDLVYDGAIDNNPRPFNSTSIQYAHNYVVDVIQRLDKGQKVNVSKTKPYGCSIKYE